MNAADALSELGYQLGIKNLALHDGVAVVLFDQQFRVEFRQWPETPDVLHLTAVVCVVDVLDVQTDFFITLLGANHLGEGTGGAAFALTTNGDRVLFTRTLVMSQLNGAEFSEAVESFVNHYDGWLRKLSDGELTQVGVGGGEGNGGALVTDAWDVAPAGAIRI